jgi:hypothetical protein
MRALVSLTSKVGEEFGVVDACAGRLDDLAIILEHNPIN